MTIAMTRQACVGCGYETARHDADGRRLWAAMLGVHVVHPAEI